MDFEQEDEFEELTIKVRKGYVLLGPILHYDHDGMEFIMVARAAGPREINRAVPVRARAQAWLEEDLIDKLHFPAEKAKPCGCSGGS